MKDHRKYLFVAVLVLITAIGSLNTKVVANRAPLPILETKTYILLSTETRPPIAEPSPPLRRSTRAISLIATPPPKPLPTPVAPTDEAVGYIIPPPPTPKPVVRSVSNVAHLLIFPVSGRITTYFSSVHPAVDIAANCGTTVSAAASGTVTFVGWKNNGGGNVVEIDHGWGMTGYNHLQGWLVDVGQTVQQGDAIAKVGSTGNSTGCHLHWQLRIGNNWLNPLQYLM